MFERIGAIRFMLDGRLHSEMDLGILFVGLRFDDYRGQNGSFGNYPIEDRPAVWRSWRERAYQRRVCRGLHVVEDKSLVTEEQQAPLQHCNNGMYLVSQSPP